MIKDELFDKFKQYNSSRQQVRNKFTQAAEAIKHLFPTDLTTEVNRVSRKSGLSIRIGTIQTRYGEYLHLKTSRGGLLDHPRPFSEEFFYHDEVEVRICHKEEFQEALQDIKDFALLVIEVAEKNHKHYQFNLDKHFK